MTAELAVYLVLGITSYIIAIIFYNHILEKRKYTNTFIVLLGILRLFISTYIRFYFRNPFANFFVSTLFMILLLLLYKSSSKSIVVSAFLLSFLYIIDNMVLYGISFTSEVLPNNLKYHPTFLMESGL